MKNLVSTLLPVVLWAGAATAMAATDYNDPPAGDKQYAMCVKTSNKDYTGGNAQSPVRGQTKAEAYCTCLWNETAEDFQGSLSKYAESLQGRRIKKICEKHADWEG